ncbi:MAG: hypothetical protein K9W42_13010 [Candidatus Heimdallarchaeota archaeon]|nr:hypothetical protein [Candidatus Heimdallarchaeota archaeon]
MPKTRVGTFFTIRPLLVEPNQRKHRKELSFLLLAATGYSIVYGIFEYTVMYTNPGYVRNGVISPYVNWAIMYTILVLLMALVTRGKIEQILLGMFFFLIGEDLIYHICYGIDIKAFPFPVYDWWDDYLASFRVLGCLGQPVAFWPYAPRYYLPGFGILLIQFIVGFVSAKGFRILNWIIEPFIVAIIASMIWNKDLYASIILIAIPITAYAYSITLLILYKKGRIKLQEQTMEEKSEEEKEKRGEKRK